MKNRFVIFVAIIFIGIATVKTFAGSQSENKKSITIGFIGKSQSNPVFVAAYTGACVAAKEIGEKNNISVVIDWQTPRNEDPQEQAQAIERFTQKGVDAISVACSDADVLTPAIDKAVDKGIPVICYDSDAPKSKRFAYYGTDDNEFGKLMMQELAREMNSKGVVAIIAGNKDAPNLQRRVRAFIEELRKYPRMKLLTNGVFYHEEIPQKAADVVARAQKANPQIGGWAFIGGWPLFIKDAIKWKPGQVKIVACDALPKELEYLKSGHVQTLIAQNCFQWGYKSVELLLNKVLKNQKTTEEFIVGHLTRVTNENVEAWSLNWKKWLLKEAVYR
ncbi:MAG: substrate-binding domain-containing protein [Bacteroidota bacterium]